MHSDLMIDDQSKIIGLMLDIQSTYLKYVGVSQTTADTTKPEWRIYREVVIGTVFQRLFASSGKYICTWDQRTTYFPAPPAVPAFIPSDDVYATGVATEATLGLVKTALTGLGLDTSLQSIKTALTGLGLDSSLQSIKTNTTGLGLDASLQAILSGLSPLAKDATLSTLSTNTGVAQVRTCTVTALTPVNTLLVSVTIAPANANRKGIILWNNSANSAYISLSASGTSAAPTWILPTFTSKEFLGPLMYTGAISAIRNAGSGTIAAWEFT